MYEFPLKAPTVLNRPSVPECAYLAGIIDGEGTVSIASARDNRDNIRRQYLAFQIGMCDLCLLLWIQERFGGTIYKHARSNKKHRQAYVLQWSAASVLNVTSQILPYLILKKPHVEILRQWVERTWSGKHGSTSHRLLTDEKKQLREELRAQLCKLNKKGPRVIAEVN